MRILDRYISKSVILIFFSCLFLFFFLYIIIDVFSHLEEIIEQKVPILILKDYYLAMLPTIFTQIAPVACLLSILFSLGRLNSDNEIIAMRSAGLNMWQISKSIIFFSIMISIAIFVINERVVPRAILKSSTLKEKYIDAPDEEKLRKRKIINNLTFYGQENRLYFIETFYPQEKFLEGIIILEQDNNQNINSKVFALKGEWLGNQWKFYQCQIFYFDSEGRIKKESQYFDEKIMDISETPQDFTKQQVQVAFMNIGQLKDYLSRFSGSNAKSIIRNLKVDLHQRIAFPFSNLVIAFVGLPFALMKRKRKGTTFASIGVAIAIGFLYYVANAVSIALGKAGILIPFLSGWLANILFLSIGLYLLKEIS